MIGRWVSSQTHRLGEEIRNKHLHLPLATHSGFPGGSDSKGSALNVEDLGLIPGSERSPRGGHDNSLQYSCLENPVDRGAWEARVQGVTQSRT